MSRAKAAPAEPLAAKIVDSGRSIDGTILARRRLPITGPLRALREDGRTNERTLAVSRVRTFAQTLRTLPAGEAQAARDVPALTPREPR